MVVARTLRHGGMEDLGHLGAVEMKFSTGAVLHEPHELQLAAVEFRVGLAVHHEGFVGQIPQAQTRHPACGAGEGHLDEVGSDSNRLKDLGTVIAGQHGDADLGENLAQTIFQSLAHVGLGLIHRQGGQFSTLDQRAGLGMLQPVTGRLPGQPGTDGAGAETDQAGQVMGTPALSGLHNDRTTQAEAQASTGDGGHNQRRARGGWPWCRG